MESKFKFAVIIPAYNEEKQISNTIKLVYKEIKKISIKSKLIIVNDGSQDLTKNNVKKLKLKNLILLSHETNKGYGSALTTGIKYCQKNKIKYALFMDSDLTNNPKDIKKFVETAKNNYDCIKASRYIKGGKMINIPKKRMYISKAGNFIAALLFKVGIKDCTNGFRMINVNKIGKYHYKEQGFAVIMEEMYILKKKKASFTEIPVILSNRKHGMSSFKYNLKIFYSYLKYPIKSIWI